MYAMRAGLTAADFDSLPPKSEYFRESNLKTLRDGARDSLNRLITVSLPTGFKGILRNGTWTVPKQAEATLTRDPPRFGDFSAAGLQDVSLTSRRIRLALGFPRLKNQTATGSPGDRGITVDTHDCQTQHATHMGDALFKVSIYANALSVAANDRSKSLFANYFLSIARQTVPDVALRAQKAIDGEGPHATLSCSDSANLCRNSKSNILGYNSGLGKPHMVLCPAALNLPPLPAACSPVSNAGKELGASAIHVILHLILTLINVAGRVIVGNVYGSGACQLLKNSHILATTRDPDSYAQLAIAQWVYGFVPPYEGNSCSPTLSIVSNILWEQRRSPTRSSPFEDKEQCVVILYHDQSAAPQGRDPRAILPLKSLN
ncbi:MAG: hypothetical protein Q9182_006863 [Xanthomendoza sp. 2 TL-2023]